MIFTDVRYSVCVPGDAERIIKAGGVHMNHCRVQQPDFVLIPGEHILSNNITLIRVGK